MELFHRCSVENRLRVRRRRFSDVDADCRSSRQSLDSSALHATSLSRFLSSLGV
jgi:hypothetical protein